MLLEAVQVLQVLLKVLQIFSRGHTPPSFDLFCTSCSSPVTGSPAENLHNPILLTILTIQSFSQSSKSHPSHNPHLQHHAPAVSADGQHTSLKSLPTRLSRADHAPPDKSAILLHVDVDEGNHQTKPNDKFHKYWTCEQPGEARRNRRW